MEKKENKLKTSCKENGRLVDLTKEIPEELLRIKEDDCFGQLWNPMDGNCSMCGDHNLCGIAYANITLKKKRKEAEDLKGPFLDQVNTDVPKSFWESTYTQIRRGNLTGQPVTVEEVAVLVQKQLKTKDELLIENTLRKFFEDYTIIVDSRVDDVPKCYTQDEQKS